MLPANFAIDLLVSALALRFAGVREIAAVLKKSILRTWLCGFAADAAGSALMAAPLIAEGFLPEAAQRRWSDALSYPVTMNPFISPAALLWTLGCISLSAFIIYGLNYKFCFRRAELTDAQRRRVSLALALFTAPWLFLLPAAWIY